MPARDPDPDLIREIDAVMAGPIATQPAVIVVGDDVLASFTPAPGWTGPV